MKYAKIFLLFTLAFVSCDKDEDNLDGKLVFSTEDFQDTRSAEFQQSNLGYCLEVSEWNGMELFIEDVQEGIYNFGRGEKNNMIWLTSYHSTWKIDRSGYLEIQKNKNDKISGTFQIKCESDLDGEIDTILGTFKDVPIVFEIKKSIGQGCGEVNDILICNSSSDYNSFDPVHKWRLHRPDGESMSVYIRRDSMIVGVMDLNTTADGVETLKPHMEYTKNGMAYSSKLGNGTLEIKSHNEEIKELQCILNGHFKSFQSNDSLYIKNFEMHLYYE